jgi:hypothetical protein
LLLRLPSWGCARVVLVSRAGAATPTTSPIITFAGAAVGKQAWAKALTYFNGTAT